jgi:hypothetical protein
MRTPISTPEIDQQQPSVNKLRKLTSAAIATFVCGLVISAPFAQAQSDASQIALQHPGWVRVPGALVRPDCVHQVPKGAGPRIENGRDTGDVSLHGNIIAHYEPCSEDATIRFAQEFDESAITNSTGSGTVEASYWDDTSLGSSDNMDFVGNDLTVPSKPSKNGGVILLYDGLEDATGTYLFSPTLQYGDNGGVGGNYWAIVTYFVTPTNTYVSPVETVNHNDSLSLFTEIYANPSSGTYDWLVEVEDLTTGAFTYQDDFSTNLHFNFAISGSLAVSNITTCSNFPASGKAVFTGTLVDHDYPSFKALTPKWKGSVYSYGGPACGFKVTAGNKTTLTF